MASRKLPPSAVRTAIASCGGTTTILKYGANTIAARARSGLDKRFQREAEEQFPNASPAELAEKAALIRKLYFNRLTLARLKKQGEKKTARQCGGSAETGGAS